jgi:hypothetical protein
MSLVVLPALRLARVQDRLRAAGLDHEQRLAVMQIIKDEIEVDARRIGAVCPNDGCNKLLDYDARRARCATHGPIRDDVYLPLAVAFDPVS